jgi:2-phosphosulfolactate phosphatase
MVGYLWPVTEATSNPPEWSEQDRFELRFEWSHAGAVALARPGTLLIVVDVLRFTTAVEAGVRAGAVVHPYRWRDPSGEAFAQSIGAIWPQPGSGLGPSLSPVSMARLPAGAVVVLPSPNGSTCAVLAAEAGATVVAGCLRNAAAVARWVSSRSDPAVVIAAGERWPDGSLRPAVEDLVGAGAILARLAGRASPEAEAAIGAFRAFEANMAGLASCASALELITKGWENDVIYALELDASRVVPVMIDGAFRSAGGVVPDAAGG